MPRACSTLLQNILAQNPEIHATPTDGSLELLYAARVNFTDSPEFKAQDSTAMLRAWRGFCWGGLQGYAEALTERPNICIKSRGIGIHYQWYNAFFSQAGAGSPKVLCMIRDLRQIFSSMEKIYQANQDSHQSIQNHAQMSGTTLEKRIDIWATSQPIGLALERFWEMRRAGILKQCHIIRAEDLTTKPAEIMAGVYDYLNLPLFKHDFDHIEQVTIEDDNVYGLSATLHKVRPKIEVMKKDYIDVLGVEVCKWVNERYDWYQREFGYK